MLDDKAWLIFYVWFVFLIFFIIFLNKIDGQTLDTETRVCLFFGTEGVPHQE
jgi:hypothetical protein